jgi:hypothetical protein
MGRYIVSLDRHKQLVAEKCYQNSLQQLSSFVNLCTIPQLFYWFVETLLLSLKQTIIYIITIIIAAPASCSVVNKDTAGRPRDDPHKGLLNIEEPRGLLLVGAIRQFYYYTQAENIKHFE